jgi:hypothetical protein
VLAKVSRKSQTNKMYWFKFLDCPSPEMKTFGFSRIQNYLFATEHNVSIVNDCGRYEESEFPNTMGSFYWNNVLSRNACPVFVTADVVSVIDVCSLRQLMHKIVSRTCFLS